MSRTLQYKITETEAGLHVSQVLSEHRFSRQNIAELKWKKGSILLDGIPAKMSQAVECDQLLTVVVEEQKDSDQIIAADLPFDVVYEDEDLLVVNKPAGMPSQPSWYYAETSLANAAAYYWKSKGWSPFVYRCIDRLDKDTSGLLILARHAVSGAILNQMHQTGELVRTYYAIAEHGDSLPEEGVIDAPVGKDMDAANRYRVDRENGLCARTHYRKLAVKDDLALLGIQLETGRTHQIRVHMSSTGHPLIGDSTYNPDDHRMARQALHAGKLEFPHPITGELMIFRAEVPEDMKVYGLD